MYKAIILHCLVGFFKDKIKILILIQQRCNQHSIYQKQLMIAKQINIEAFLDPSPSTTAKVSIP